MDKYVEIRLQYPAVITKEQFYKIAHISKKNAAYYLENGYLPCIKSTGKTRKYKIKTEDVIYFIKQREKHPHYFKLHNPIFSEFKFMAWQLFVPLIMEDYPDVLTVPIICHICGYPPKTILQWFNEKRIFGFKVNQALHIPKKSLTAFMCSREFADRPCKSTVHLSHIKQFNEWMKAEASLPDISPNRLEDITDSIKAKK